MLNSRAIFDTFLRSTEVDFPTGSGGAVRSKVGGSGSFGRLRRSRQRLGSQRHDLLVALRVVNSIEREMVEAQWEAWLNEENAMCKQTEVLMDRNHTGSHIGGDGQRVDDQQRSEVGLPERSQVVAWHQDYCGSCAREKQVMDVEQAGSVE